MWCGSAGCQTTAVTQTYYTKTKVKRLLNQYEFFFTFFVIRNVCEQFNCQHFKELESFRLNHSFITWIHFVVAFCVHHIDVSVELSSITHKHNVIHFFVLFGYESSILILQFIQFWNELFASFLLMLLFDCSVCLFFFISHLKLL